jgi:hypothetical protein
MVGRTELGEQGYKLVLFKFFIAYYIRI